MGNELEFTRDMFQALRNKAIGHATSGVNINWHSAYMQLADAADRLDAMVARTESRAFVEEICAD